METIRGHGKAQCPVTGFVVGSIIKVDGIIVFQYKRHDDIKIIPATGRPRDNDRVAYITFEFQWGRGAVLLADSQEQKANAKLYEVFAEHKFQILKNKFQTKFKLQNSNIKHQQQHIAQLSNSPADR
jgi:hypothetical protein